WYYPTMTGSLKQMNISYQPKEDRLLLKISTSSNSEYRIWMTRRFTSLLLNVLSEQMDARGGIQKVASTPDTRERLKNTDAAQEYESGPDMEYPLGADGILAFKINAAKNREGKLNLQLLPEDGEGVNFALDDSMIYMLHNLIERCIFKTDWNLQSTQMLQANLH
ncbi:MAG: hypothetical protein WD601_00795, partial [Pseudohongiellaceae bacterium]